MRGDVQRSTSRDGLVGAVLCVVVASLVSGCSLGGSDPDGAADRLAGALGRGDVSKIRFDNGTGTAVQPRLAAILDGMAPLSAEVTVTDLETDGDIATGTVRWSWDTGSRDWVDKGRVRLVKKDDTWRPVWDPSVVRKELLDDERLDATTLLAQRGDILGARDVPLVTLRAVDRYGIDKTAVNATNAVSAARALGRLLSSYDVDPAAFAERVRKAGPKAFVEAITLRRGEGGPTETGLADRAELIPGVKVVPAREPLAPSRTFAAPILGRVGSPTAEMVKKSERSDTPLRATDQVGIGGLERRYDSQLSGRPGVRINQIDAEGNATTVHRTEPVAGEALRTTLDLDAQKLAEKTLSGTTSAAALVAIRPSTGQIIAAASGPASGGQNTATYSRYAPGSTFKVVTSLALLRAGVTPSTEVECPASVTVDGKDFTNYSDYPSSAVGQISYLSAIANSCNTAVIGQRDEIKGSALSDAAAALGLGIDHDLGFPAYFGQVPPPASETEKAADLIGQGKVLASPMAMAAVAASVAKGSTVTPQLVLQPAGSTPVTPSPDSTPAKPLTEAEAGSLRTLMRAVVTDGSGRTLAGLPGDPVLAKTGTAEYGEATPPKTHAWMIAIHGDLAVAVFVADGKSGSGTAGPILKAFLAEQQ